MSEYTGEDVSNLGKRLYGDRETGKGAYTVPLSELMGVTTRHLRRIIKDGDIPQIKQKQIGRLMDLAKHVPESEKPDKPVDAAS